jgi:hypothetical protein
MMSPSEHTIDARNTGTPLICHSQFCQDKTWAWNAQKVHTRIQIMDWLAPRIICRQIDRSCCMCRFGQSYIYTVYIRWFWQGNHQIYGHIRCIYTVLANPMHVCFSCCLPSLQITANCLHPGVVKTELGRYMITEENKWYMVRVWLCMYVCCTRIYLSLLCIFYRLISPTGYRNNCVCVCTSLLCLFYLTLAVSSQTGYSRAQLSCWAPILLVRAF